MAGLAALAGAVTVLVSAQALGRTLRRSRADDQSLAAVGCTRGQLVVADLAYAATQGWLNPAGDAIQAHVVWQG